MKLTLATTLALAVSLATSAFAAEKKEEKKGGPNGGRVIKAVEPPLEFLVTDSRKVEITALTKDYTPDKLNGQTVTVTAGDRSKPTKLEFKEEGGKLISTNALPAGDGYPVSVGIKTAASAKTVYEKFTLDIDQCPTCKYKEYACVCEHADGKEKKK